MYTAQSVENKQTSKQRTFALPPMKRLITPIIVLVVGIGLSITAMKLVDYKVQSDMQLEFDKAVSSLYSRANSGFSRQEQVLTNLDGLFKASVQVVRDVFELYSTIPAKSEPGILSIAYANQVGSAQLQDLILYNRSEGNMGYKVFPIGTRPLYEPISYIVPFEKNAHISGMDLLSNPVFAHAISKTNSSHKSVSTPMFNYRGADTMSLVLMTSVEKKKSTGASDLDMLMSKPGDKFDGVVYLELDVNRFLHGTIGDTVGSDKNIIYEIKTRDLNNTDQVVFQSPNFKSALTQTSGVLRTSRSFNFGDKEFVISFTNSATLGVGLQSHLGLITLVFGLLLTLSLVALLLSMLSSEDRAIRLADSITESNSRILKISRDIVAVMGHTGVWHAVNPAVKSILGYEISEFENRHISQFLLKPTDFESLQAELLSTSEESYFDFTAQMRCRDGSLRWISWHFTVIASEGIVYCNGHDITDSKVAEEQIKLKSKQLEIAEQLAHEASEFKSTFMIKLTDRVRGSLADSLLNLHKISANMDFSDNSQLQFLKLANQSSDQMYNIVSDLLEVAKGNDVDSDCLSTKLTDCLHSAHQTLREETSRKVNVMTGTIRGEYSACVDDKTLSSALYHIMGALTEGAENASIQCTVDENTAENVLELQMYATENELVEQMIEQYNRSQGNLIDELVHDKDNIMFRFGVAASQFRRMNCNISVATLGDEGNVVMITLPASSIALETAADRRTHSVEYR